MGKYDTELIGTAEGDGAVDAETVSAFKRETESWNSRASRFWERRAESTDARRCLWSGQSPDGRLWAKQNGNKTPTPFDGASDQRVRWADEAVINKVALVMGAMGMAEPSVQAAGPRAERTAKNLTVLLRWMIRDLGAEWMRQWLALGSHTYGDAPAVGMMRVAWRKATRLEYVTVTAGELETMWMDREMARAEGGGRRTEARGQNGEGEGEEGEGLGLGLGLGGEGEGEGAIEELQRAAEEMRMMLAGDADPAAAEALLRERFGVTAARAARVVRELRKYGKAEFPITVMDGEGAQIEAMRMGEDFIVPDNCRDFQKAELWFRPEWMTATELKALVQEDGWDAEWVDKVIAGAQRALLKDALEQSATEDDLKGLHQVVWCYHTAISEDGVRAKYVTVIGSPEGTPFGRRMIRGRRGRWPTVFFQREVMSRYLLDSRGIPELVGPAQGAAKKLRDTATDNGIIGGLPPTLAKGFSVRNQFVAPLKPITMGVNEDFGFMNPPQFPAAAERVYDKIRDEKDDYLGEARDGSDPATVATRKKLDADWWLVQVWDVLRMMLELAQDNASDELLAAVTDDAGEVRGLRREDIAGRFRVQLNFNVEDMDTEMVIKKMEALGKVILAMDANKTVDTAVPVAHGMRILFPTISEAAIRSGAAASQKETEDEAKNLSMIRAGAMPVMNTEGLWNYQARIDWYKGLTEQNPAVFADMAADKRAMLEQWLQALAQQAVQYGENRAIGRTGAEGVESE